MATTSTLLAHEQKTLGLINEEGFAALARAEVARELVHISRFVNPSASATLQSARNLFSNLPNTDGAKVELFSINGEDDGAGININFPSTGKAVVSLPKNIDQIVDAFNSIYPAFRITITTGSTDLAQGRIKRYSSRGGVYTTSPQFSNRESFPFATLGEALSEAVKGLTRGLFPYEGEVEFRFDG